jgi:hypothetical protein
VDDAQVVTVEGAKIVDAVLEHGDTHRSQPWRRNLAWRDVAALTGAAHELSEFLHRLLEPP